MPILIKLNGKAPAAKKKPGVPHHCTALSPAPRAGKDASGRDGQRRPRVPQAGAGRGNDRREWYLHSESCAACIAEL